jgi:hypothetical protein
VSRNRETNAENPQISVKPEFWLSLSIAVTLFVELETLLQELDHADSTADGVPFVFSLELRSDLEIQRFSFKGWRLFEILGAFAPVLEELHVLFAEVVLSLPSSRPSFFSFGCQVDDALNHLRRPRV